MSLYELSTPGLLRGLGFFGWSGGGLTISVQSVDFPDALVLFLSACSSPKD